MRDFAGRVDERGRTWRVLAARTLALVVCVGGLSVASVVAAPVAAMAQSGGAS